MHLHLYIALGSKGSLSRITRLPPHNLWLSVCTSRYCGTREPTPPVQKHSFFHRRHLCVFHSNSSGNTAHIVCAGDSSVHPCNFVLSHRWIPTGCLIVSFHIIDAGDSSVHSYYCWHRRHLHALMTPPRRLLHRRGSCSWCWRLLRALL
jgi:hypothetical protein